MVFSIITLAIQFLFFLIVNMAGSGTTPELTVTIFILSIIDSLLSMWALFVNITKLGDDYNQKKHIVGLILSIVSIILGLIVVITSIIMAF